MKAPGLARLAMRHVVPVSLSDAPGAAPTAPTHNGSMTLLRLPHRRVGVTCHHVVEAYREQRRSSSGRVFRAGGQALDPLDRLLAADPILDLVLIDLDDMEPARLFAGGPDVDFFEPPTWPLGTAESGDAMALGGHPSAARVADPCAPVPAGYTLGVARVIDAGRENIVCGLGPQDWLESTEAGGPEALGDGGGLSGGAGFVRRDAELHLAGVIFVVALHGGYLRLRPARFIRRDGTLGRD